MNINDYTPRRSGTYAEFVSSENGCKHIGRNVSGHEIRQFKIDGEVITKNADTARCDYLLLNDDAKSAYYIELKGSDLEKAIQQIESTVRMLQDSLTGYATYRRIIYFSGTTDIRGKRCTALESKASHGSNKTESFIRGNIVKRRQQCTIAYIAVAFCLSY